ncbi:MAG TPA: hypothetical protein VGP47_11640 [Parachlamydiaceae bacterium]|nr:hypothetical protein [Parachlamydiaceae bacterium]
MMFENPERKTHQELLKIFSSGDANEICDALVAMAFYDEDWKWCQEQCLFLLEHFDKNISGLAAICLGHIARIHGQLDKELVESVLSNHLNNKEISGRIEDALGDIKMFLG